MDKSILSSPAVREHKPDMEWKTPERSVIRAMKREGKSYGEIMKETGLVCSSIQRIVKAPSSKRLRKGKVFKPKLITL